jgi:hypothetical protein
MAAAYMYILYQPGIASLESYQYQEFNQHDDVYKCRYDVATSVATTTGYSRILPGNETLLKDVVAAVGPVAFGMNSAPPTFLFYR